MTARSLVLLVVLGVPTMVRAAPGEMGFSPTHLRVPLVAISLRNSTTGLEQSIYGCTSGSCVHDLTDDADLAALFANMPTLPVGTYDELNVQYCNGAAGYQAEVEGQATIDGTIYYTKNDADILTTTAADAGPVHVTFAGCSTRYALATPLVVVAGQTYDLSMFAFSRYAGWMAISAGATPGGCVKNSAGDRRLCASPPDLIPVVGASSAAATVELYALDGEASGPSDKVSGIVLLVVDGASGEVVTGVTRELHMPSSVEFVQGFGTALHRISKNSDGTYLLENYGGAPGAYYLRLPSFVRGRDHAGSLDHAGLATVPYRSFYIPDPNAANGGTDGGTGGGSDPQPSCVFDATPRFPTPLLDPALIRVATTPGMLGGGNTSIVGRSYIFPDKTLVPDGTPLPLYAPTAMRLTGLSHYHPVQGSDDWALSFQVSCQVQLTLAHVKNVSPAIEAAWGNRPIVNLAENSAGSAVAPPYTTVTLAPGDAIGNWVGEPYSVAFDFVVENRARPVAQFANQPRYDVSNITYTDCPYSYYPQDIQDLYLAKIGSVISGPVSGAPCRRSSSRDVVGSAAGQWFKDPDPSVGVGVFDMVSRFGNPFVIVSDANGDVMVGNLDAPGGYRVFRISGGQPDPETITGEHCYQVHDNQDCVGDCGWVYVSVTSSTSMDVNFASLGTCPASFPATGKQTYYR